MATSTGRPRSFDTDEALQEALDVFWRHGYEGASLRELTAAMGIAKTSMYAAFGDKRDLFGKVLERYFAAEMAYVDDALDQPTARDVVASLLSGTVEAITRPGRPPGCLTIQSALATGPQNAEISQMLARARDDGERALRDRLQRAVDEHDLGPDVDPGALANYVMALLAGLAVRAGDGATRAELARGAELARATLSPMLQPNA